MRTLRTACGVLVSLAVVAAASLAMPAEEKEEGFKALGKAMSDFDLIVEKGKSAEDTWKVDGNVILCSGKPNGYFATKKSYKNYVLRFDFKYVRPEGLANDNDFKGNSGYLIHITGEHNVWPKSVEVQGMNLNAGQIFAISGAKKVNAKDNPEARKKALKPVGEWNSLEIVSKDGALTAILNGTKVCESDASDVTEGPIGFQSEGAEIHFRKLRIKEM